jgi:hypothetical protein
MFMLGDTYTELLYSTTRDLAGLHDKHVFSPLGKPGSIIRLMVIKSNTMIVEQKVVTCEK